MPRAKHNMGVLIALGVAAAAGGAGGALALDWPTLAGNPQRLAFAEAGPTSLAEPSWIFTETPLGPFEPVGQSGVITGAGKVFAAGEINGAAALVAIDAESGDFAWAAPVPAPAFESWSTPTYDERTGVVYVASGRRVTALDASSGAELWQSGLLAGDVVNATPVVTTDLGEANRLFITDSSGFGGGGRLYCINIDPRHMTLNPFGRGEIVWEFDLGQTAGSTPAYDDGVVYVASAGDSSGRPPGLLFALPAGVSVSPNPLWATPNPAPEGFYGGVCVATSGGQRVLYAASYSFYGGLMSGNLVKVRAQTGEVVWSIPANRTASIPVPLGDGRLLLSAGLQGFGTVPSVQMFRDNGASAQLVWDSALWTWKDLDGDGRLDPGEFTPMGGWTHQPAAAKAGMMTVAVFGTVAVAGFDPYERLRVVDLKRSPDHPNFILGEGPAGGSTPALSGGSVFSIGPEGVVGYVADSSGCYADCDGSGQVDLFDVLCYQALYTSGDPRADCDGSGSVDFFDFLCFMALYLQGC